MQIQDLRDKYKLEVYTEGSSRSTGIDYKSIMKGLYRVYSLDPFRRITSEYYLNERLAPDPVQPNAYLTVYPKGQIDVRITEGCPYKFLFDHKELIEKAIYDTEQTDWLCRIWNEFRIEPVSRTSYWALVGRWWGSSTYVLYDVFDLSRNVSTAQTVLVSSHTDTAFLSVEEIRVMVPNGSRAASYLVLPINSTLPDYKEVYEKLVQNFNDLKVKENEHQRDNQQV